MTYRLGKIQSTTGLGADEPSWGFNIMNDHGAPIVTFAYDDQIDAAKARTLIEQAITRATNITGYASGR